MKSIWTYTNALMLILAFGVIFSSCKSKKKMASVSDQATVSEQIQEEIEEDEEIVLESEAERDRANATTNRLNSYFQSIATAPSVASANNSIAEATSMFRSPEIPVLIIFYAADGREEYDEPTTISKYLNYLKDQKKNPNVIQDFTVDASGKITELVLMKRD